MNLQSPNSFHIRRRDNQELSGAVAKLLFGEKNMKRIQLVLCLLPALMVLGGCGSATSKATSSAAGYSQISDPASKLRAFIDQQGSGRSYMLQSVSFSKGARSVYGYISYSGTSFTLETYETVTDPKKVVSDYSYWFTTRATFTWTWGQIGSGNYQINATYAYYSLSITEKISYTWSNGGFSNEAISSESDSNPSAVSQLNVLTGSNQGERVLDSGTGMMASTCTARYAEKATSFGLPALR